MHFIVVFPKLYSIIKFSSDEDALEFMFKGIILIYHDYELFDLMLH